ncbi:MAG: cytochrome c [Alphaproteobacteria bacterium]|nr:cytochrome c [Alphaproteobacteria bacterium]HJP23646.1 cytochrome c [Alphaproteobacteria bacterium]
MSLRFSFGASLFLALVLWSGPRGEGLAALPGGDAGRGAYLVRVAGCINCHTAPDGPELAGGRVLKTPFGNFISPNITPHRQHGIGGWSEADLVRALRHGERPDGASYYPVFPYTSYSGMRLQDMKDIFAHLMAGPARANKVAGHDLRWPFSWRFLMWIWKWLFFEPGAFADDPGKSASWNRGAYLVQVVAHCGECHTGRNWLGAVDHALVLAGTAKGPDGRSVPNITPDNRTGIGGWSRGDVVDLLSSGLKPDFDDVQGAMAEAIEGGLKFLTPADRGAIADYLLTLPPRRHRIPGRRGA